MAERVLETDFPLIAPPNPPLSVHPRVVNDLGRNGSLKRAYSSEEVSEVTPLHTGAGVSDHDSDTSDYLSDSPGQGQGPPGYTTLPPDHQHQYKTNSLSHPPFRPPTHRYRIVWYQIDCVCFFENISNLPLIDSNYHHKSSYNYWLFWLNLLEQCGEVEKFPCIIWTEPCHDKCCPSTQWSKKLHAQLFL